MIVITPPSQEMVWASEFGCSIVQSWEDPPSQRDVVGTVFSIKNIMTFALYPDVTEHMCQNLQFWCNCLEHE